MCSGAAPGRQEQAVDTSRDILCLIFLQHACPRCSPDACVFWKVGVVDAVGVKEYRLGNDGGPAWSRNERKAG